MLKNARSLAIVIELENIEISGRGRAFANIRVLQSQMQEIAGLLPEPIALKIVYDSNVFTRSDAESFINDTGMGENPLVICETIGAPAIHYYQHKNVGAAHCTSDVVLFMDSDILIEDGWLQNMVSAFDNEAVNFVSGRSHIETPRFFDKIYALTTPGFPLAEQHGQGLVETTRIMANSFAYRSSRVEGGLFPEIDAYRGHCGIAAKRLIGAGETLYVQSDAVARHPSVDGVGSYFARAFSEGCDAITHSRYNNRSGFRGMANRSLIGSVHRLGRGIWGVIKRSCTSYRKVSLPVIGIPAAIGVGAIYFGVRFAGEVTTLVSARLARRLSIAKVTH